MLGYTAQPQSKGAACRETGTDLIPSLSLATGVAGTTEYFQHGDLKKLKAIKC